MILRTHHSRSKHTNRPMEAFILTIRTIQKGEKAILGPILEARMAIQVIS